MEGTTGEIDRLYELYGQYFDRLVSEVVLANRSLGSSHPERTGLKRLNRAEFEELLKDGYDDVVRQWIRGIVRGHEHEFPRWHIAGKLFGPHKSQLEGAYSPAGAKRESDITQSSTLSRRSQNCQATKQD